MQAFNQMVFWYMEFPERLTALRKQRGLTQQALADLVGCQVLQIRRYEGGTSQPTLEAIRRLARSLRVSADALVFDEAERRPDQELLFQFEAVSRLPSNERDAIGTMLEAMIVKSQVSGVLQSVAKASIQRRGSGGQPQRSSG